MLLQAIVGARSTPIVSYLHCLMLIERRYLAIKISSYFRIGIFCLYRFIHLHLITNSDILQGHSLAYLFRLLVRLYFIYIIQHYNFFLVLVPLIFTLLKASPLTMCTTRDFFRLHDILSSSVLFITSLFLIFSVILFSLSFPITTARNFPRCMD